MGESLAAHARIAAGTSATDISTRAAIQRVVARVTAEPIVAGAAEQTIEANAAAQKVATLAAADDVVTASPADLVISTETIDDIRSSGANDRLAVCCAYLRWRMPTAPQRRYRMTVVCSASVLLVSSESQV